MNRKKVLIITYYWPPAGGPGVQRVLKFAKYLPQFGWQPIILTVKNGEYPAIDESLLSEIPKDCIVYRTKAIEPFNFYRKFTGRKIDDKIPTYVLNKKKNERFKDNLTKWIRANLFIPDARIGWLPYLFRNGMKIIEKEKPDVIFSSSPPHSLQIGARLLAKKSGLKWIVDFRDPWLEGRWLKDLHRNVLTIKLDAYLEKLVLRNADAITTVSTEIKKMFYHKLRNNYYIIHSGYEKITNAKIKTTAFEILFFGHLSKYQNPEPVFKAVSSLSKEVQQSIKIFFIGTIFEDFTQLFDIYRNLDIVQMDYMPYKKVMSYAQKASLLFLPHNTGLSYSKGLVGAKLYDYLSLRKPILALGEKGSITETILDTTKSGKLFRYSDVDDIAKYIKNTFIQWQKNFYLSLNDNKELKKYSTILNVKKLTNIFEGELLNV